MEKNKNSLQFILSLAGPIGFIIGSVLLWDRRESYNNPVFIDCFVVVSILCWTGLIFWAIRRRSKYSKHQNPK